MTICFLLSKNAKAVATISQPTNAIMGNETTEVKPPQEIAAKTSENSHISEVKKENVGSATTPLVCLELYDIF